MKEFPMTLVYTRKTGQLLTQYEIDIKLRGQKLPEGVTKLLRGFFPDVVWEQLVVISEQEISGYVQAAMEKYLANEA